MGQMLTKKKEEYTYAPARIRPTTVSPTQHYFTDYAEFFKKHGVIPDIFLVHETSSQQYVDEDGSVANEFYTEEVDGKERKLRKVVENITPKGKEKYAIPRLRSDIPVVLWELTQQRSEKKSRR